MGISSTQTEGITKRYRNLNLNHALFGEFKITFVITIYFFSLHFFDGVKPSNWSPVYLKYLQSLYLNVNIQVLSPQGIVKYITKSENRKVEHVMRQFQMTSNISRSIASDDGFISAKSSNEINDDEQHLMEILIR